MPELKTGLDVLKIILRHNIESSVNADAIEALTHVVPREIAEIVQIAASAGVPVGSCARGYYGWRTKEEREAYLEREKSRLQSLGRKIAAVKKNARNELSLFEQS